MKGRLGVQIPGHTTGDMRQSMLRTVWFLSVTGVPVYVEYDFSVEVMMYFEIVFMFWGAGALQFI